MLGQVQGFGLLGRYIEGGCICLHILISIVMFRHLHTHLYFHQCVCTSVIMLYIS